MTENNSLNPAYLLSGPQTLLIERYVEKIKSELEKIDPEFIQTTYYSDADSVEEILGKAKTVSIFSETRLIVIKNCEKLKRDDIASIENYLDSPSPETFIVFISNETNKPKLKKHINLEAKIFKAVDRIENRIQKEAELLGIKLTRKASHEIFELIGDDLKSINSELLKLSQYFKNKEVIDEKDINAFIKKRNREDIFRLINSIAGKDKNSAVKVLNELRAVNYDPVSVVSTLSWRFRQIWHLKELQSSKKDANAIIRELKISSGALFYLKKQADKFSLKSLSETMSMLSGVDAELKSYSQDKYNLISRFIFKLCGSR